MDFQKGEREEKGKRRGFLRLGRRKNPSCPQFSTNNDQRLEDPGVVILQFAMLYLNLEERTFFGTMRSLVPPRVGSWRATVHFFKTFKFCEYFSDARLSIASRLSLQLTSNQAKANHPSSCPLFTASTRGKIEVISYLDSLYCLHGGGVSVV